MVPGRISPAPEIQGDSGTGAIARQDLYHGCAGSEPRGADRTSDRPFNKPDSEPAVSTEAPFGETDDNVQLPTEEEIAAHTPPTPVAEVVAEPVKPAGTEKDPVSPTAAKAKKVNLLIGNQ